MLVFTKATKKVCVLTKIQCFTDEKNSATMIVKREQERKRKQKIVVEKSIIHCLKCAADLDIICAKSTKKRGRYTIT